MNLTTPTPPSLRRFVRDERGTNLVEFAMVVTVLMLLVFGSIEFGRVLNTFIVVTNGAREGARVAALGRPLSEIRARVVSAMPGFDPALISTTGTNVQGTAGTQVTITVAYPVTIMLPLIQPFFPTNPFPVQSSVAMRLES